MGGRGGGGRGDCDDISTGVREGKGIGLGQSIRMTVTYHKKRMSIKAHTVITALRTYS